MWPYIKLNPVAIIILMLIFFSLYLIYSANSITNNYFRNYEEQNLLNANRKKLYPEEDGDVFMPALNNRRESGLINDEIIKKEFKLFEQVSLIELLNVAIQIARNGGKQVFKVRETNNLKQKEKGFKDPYTEGDLRSHQVMIGQLSAAFPGIRIISEEANTNIDNISNVPFNFVNRIKLIDELKNIKTNQHLALSELTVWIDPLDATQEYTENLTKYVTTMVCVAYKGRPIIGVIHKVFKNNLDTNYNRSNTYWAWDKIALSKNIENAINKRKKEVNLNDNLKIIISRSHTGSVKLLSDQIFGKNTKIITAGGSGYKTIELINGNSDVYLHNSLIKKWDICASNAILNSISHKIKANFTSLKGEYIKYTDEDVKNHDGLLATIALDHDKIIDNLRNFI